MAHSPVLTNSTEFKISKKLISQFAGAKTDIFTGLRAHDLCKDFRLSIRGQRNMNTSFKNLPCYDTLDERLTFGWSPEHIIHVREVQEGGYEHLALVIALSEFFHETYTMHVLHELVMLSTEPDQMTPHFREWRGLIRSLNGAFATADFGLLLEEYFRINPYTLIGRYDFSKFQSPIPPKQIALALVALSHVTSGRTKRVTMIGSGSIAWFAAVSEWLYDLRIVIYSADGKQLRVSHPGAETQAIFVFEETYGLRVLTTPWKHDIDHLTTQISQVQMVLAPSYAQSIHFTSFGGRVVWQSLLPKVFGQSFHYLDHGEPKAMADLIGSGARLFEALAYGEGEASKHGDLVSAQNKCNPASLGLGLIVTLANFLPELRKFQGRMERSLKLSYEDASKRYLESLTTIRSICKCGICCAKDEVDTKMERKAPAHGYCLTVLCETIIAMGLALSRITVSSYIYPSRAGIQSFYSGQVDKRMEARGLDWTQHFALIYGNEWNAPDARRLQNVLQIFAGSRPMFDVPPNLVALEHEGMCAYFVCIEKESASHQDEPVKLIRVVSGGINIRQKVFRRAAIGPVADADPDRPWEEVRVQHIAQGLYCR